MGALALRPADLRTFDGEPRVQDLRLGEVLGYDRPRDLRKVIRGNLAELLTYGEVSRQLGAKPSGGSRGGRPEESFYLSEPQALLVIMFSRTSAAAEVRRQTISIFLAHRHGQLAPRARVADPLEALARRVDLLERVSSFAPARTGRNHAREIAHMPVHPRRRYPAFWHDAEVRGFLIAEHRQMTVRQTISECHARFGRAPSKSAIARFWMWLDQVSGRRIGSAAA